MSMREIPKTIPVAPWLGGKRNLAKRICALIDNDPGHRTHAEPFVGIWAGSSCDGHDVRRPR